MHASAYHTPAPASDKVLRDSLLDGSTSPAQQTQVATIHKQVAVNACLLQALGRKLLHRHTAVKTLPASLVLQQRM